MTLRKCIETRYKDILHKNVDNAYAHTQKTFITTLRKTSLKKQSQKLCLKVAVWFKYQSLFRIESKITR